MRRVAVPVVLAVVSACASSKTSPRDLGPCVADALEPNDDARTRASFGTIQDDDEIGQGDEAPPKRIRRDLTLHEGADVDWFDVDVRDTGLGGNPGLRVMVSEGFEATAFWDCTRGATKAVACGLGTKVTDDPELAGMGCVTQAGSSGVPAQLTMQIECDGTSEDSGTLHVRVRRAGAADACARYALTVEAE